MNDVTSQVVAMYQPTFEDYGFEWAHQSGVMLSLPPRHSIAFKGLKELFESDVVQKAPTDLEFMKPALMLVKGWLSGFMYHGVDFAQLEANNFPPLGKTHFMIIANMIYSIITPEKKHVRGFEGTEFIKVYFRNGIERGRNLAIMRLGVTEYEALDIDETI